LSGWAKNARLCGQDCKEPLTFEGGKRCFSLKYFRISASVGDQVPEKILESSVVTLIFNRIANCKDGITESILEIPISGDNSQGGKSAVLSLIISKLFTL
jgi:hypothetical protein